ncbi:MAG: BrnT family toxin [Verrucomicrobia bacterium]|nr:BrnT family toxin [Verrucomicrobiota bacterium]MCH8513487.1 BrnT family toxin [Kiritimatiellia bacterium]
MNELHFAWDPSKNETNRQKHGVRFEEAQTVFFDDAAMEFFDSDHSDDEDRFLLLGQSFKLRTLMVCHCFRETDQVIRLISARKATAKERKTYQRNRP